MLCHFSLLAVFARFQSFGTSPPVMNGRPSEVAFVSSDPELQSRLISNRVFGTFVYPNALAGFLVVAFAPVLAWLPAAESAERC